jgi:hypothetical protein
MQNQAGKSQIVTGGRLAPMSSTKDAWHLSPWLKRLTGAPIPASDDLEGAKVPASD